MDKLQLYKRNKDESLADSGLFLAMQNGEPAVVDADGVLAFVGEALYVKAPLPDGLSLYGSEGA